MPLACTASVSMLTPCDVRGFTAALSFYFATHLLCDADGVDHITDFNYKLNQRVNSVRKVLKLKLKLGGG